MMLDDSPLNHIDKNILNAHKITQIDNLKMNIESEILAIVRSIKSIVVKNGNVEGALRTMKQKNMKDGLLKAVRERNEGYMKPGVKRREAKKEAIRNNRRNNRDNY